MSIKKALGDTKIDSFKILILAHFFLFIGLSRNSVGEYFSIVVIKTLDNVTELDASLNFILLGSIFLILLSKFKLRSNASMFLYEKKLMSAFKMLDIVSILLSFVIFVPLILIPFILQSHLVYSVSEWFSNNRWAIMVTAYVLVFYIIFIIIELGENFLRSIMFFLKKANDKISKIQDPAERYTLLIAIFATIISLITLIKE